MMIWLACAVEAFLANSPKVVEYCERCGDKAPGLPYVYAEGQRTDVRYTYVQTSPERYENLALLAGCDIDPEAPASLTVSDETDHGVMITADQTSQPKPAPQVAYYATTIEQPLPWTVVALAAGGGAIVGGGLFVLVIASRRRRAMRPRAADLAPR